MAIADREPHAPEIEAAQEGFNCKFFESDNASALARLLEEFIADQSYWRNQGDAIASDCAKHYTAEAMAAGLIRALALDDA
jgi:hypothetical protein